MVIKGSYGVAPIRLSTPRRKEERRCRSADNTPRNSFHQDDPDTALSRETPESTESHEDSGMVGFHTSNLYSPAWSGPRAARTPNTEGPPKNSRLNVDTQSHESAPHDPERSNALNTPHYRPSPQQDGSKSPLTFIDRYTQQQRYNDNLRDAETQAQTHAPPDTEAITPRTLEECVRRLSESEKEIRALREKVERLSQPSLDDQQRPLNTERRIQTPPRAQTPHTHTHTDAHTRPRTRTRPAGMAPPQSRVESIGQKGGRKKISSNKGWARVCGVLINLAILAVILLMAYEAGVFQALGTAFRAASKQLQSVSIGVSHALSSAVSTAYKQVQNGSIGVFQALSTASNAAYKHVQSGSSRLSQALGTALNTGYRHLLDAYHGVRHFSSELFHTGQSVLTGLYRGLHNAGTDVLSGVSKLWQRVVEPLKNGSAALSRNLQSSFSRLSSHVQAGVTDGFSHVKTFSVEAFENVKAHSREYMHIGSKAAIQSYVRLAATLKGVWQGLSHTLSRR